MVAFKVKNLLFVIFVVLFCSPTSLFIKVVSSIERASPSLCPVLTLAYSVAFKQFLLLIASVRSISRKVFRPFKQPFLFEEDIELKFE